jgi:hypothetical protein
LQLVSAALALAACFAPMQPVAIEGYADHAMEPFIARDGQTLFFNNRNEPAEETDLHWASRIDDTHFRYRGAITSANSNHLDGVASFARDGTFAFTSLRAFESRGATIWMGRWTGEAVTALSLETALRPGPPPRFNMDGELSASAARFYVTDNLWALIGGLRTSDIRLAVRENGRWRRAPEFDSWFAAINTRDALEYAPATNEAETELYFTRLTRPFLRPPRFETFVAVRDSANEAFGRPERIGALRGYVEAASVAPDGALYAHAMLNGRFTIMRSARVCAS